MEQSVFNAEHIFARLVICPGLFEQLGPIQQCHKFCRAESKSDICLISFPDLLSMKPKARSGKVSKFVFLD